ncbi:phosphotransferase family protein [Streptomyces sp. TLI_171]|uniref:phosphotransferase family protein n=1 Tax=Streptomyces sp. TLI_171 TaxID=1938859 RepID=UPI000C175D68|nr:phosphotransferase [Streptomyces sp. TLI_171]RKE17028.1 phosphotransferase family enzyme [Streptomyces sp. TLI_171]
MTSPWSTHTVELLPDTVRKRFRPEANGDPAREWRALTLLDRFAPGLAPRPISSDGGVITMSRLPGGPLRGAALTPGQLDALAAAVDRLLRAVPADVAARLPRRRWDVAHTVAAIRARTRSAAPPEEPAVRRALAEGMRWLAKSEPDLRGSGLAATPVLGQADGNLANFLWDGSAVRVVDFEDSGRSDRPYELAELVEHVSAWVDPGAVLDHAGFVARFELSSAEARRLLMCRRLFALLWLVFLTGDPGTERGHPPGTASRQAGRLRALLA